MTRLLIYSMGIVEAVEEKSWGSLPENPVVFSPDPFFGYNTY